MEYKIEDVGTFKGSIVKNLGRGSYIIRINDTEHALKIIEMDARGMEFTLDDMYHRARYLERSTSGLRISVNGIDVTVNTNPHLDEIVYKNSGGGSTADSSMVLHSQIPGKVVSIAAEAGSEVKEGDIVCTLESMKMQVGIKAHKAGTVKSVKVSQGSSIAKGDVIAEIE